MKYILVLSALFIISNNISAGNPEEKRKVASDEAFYNICFRTSVIVFGKNCEEAEKNFKEKIQKTLVDLSAKGYQTDRIDRNECDVPQSYTGVPGGAQINAEVYYKK